MGRYLQHSLSMAFGLALVGCSTGLATQAGKSVSANSYNSAMSDQGLDYYCGTGRCDIAPTLIHAVAPQYPQTALTERRTGMASVIFDIEADGHVTNITLESASHPDFGKAALQAISSWKYEPAMLEGKPVRIGPLRQVIPFTR